jgi:hypothetical protein
LSTADDVARGNALADKTANKLWSDATLADATTRLEAVRQSALKTGDPVEAAKLIQTGNDLITSLADKGIITQESAVKYRQEWTTKYAAGKLAMLPADQRMDALRPAAQGRDAVLDRIGGIENSSGNPARALGDVVGDGRFPVHQQDLARDRQGEPARPAGRPHRKASSGSARRSETLPRNGGLSAGRQRGGAAKGGVEPTRPTSIWRISSGRPTPRLC